MPATPGYRLETWGEPPMVTRSHELDPGLLDRSYIPPSRAACAEFILHYGLPEVDAYRSVAPAVAESIASDVADTLYVKGQDVVAALEGYTGAAGRSNAKM